MDQAPYVRRGWSRAALEAWKALRFAMLTYWRNRMGLVAFLWLSAVTWWMRGALVMRERRGAVWGGRGKACQFAVTCVAACARG